MYMYVSHAVVWTVLCKLNLWWTLNIECEYHTCVMHHNVCQEFFDNLTLSKPAAIIGMFKAILYVNMKVKAKILLESKSSWTLDESYTVAWKARVHELLMKVIIIYLFFSCQCSHSWHSSAVAVVLTVPSHRETLTSQFCTNKIIHLILWLTYHYFVYIVTKYNRLVQLYTCERLYNLYGGLWNKKVIFSSVIAWMDTV